MPAAHDLLLFIAAALVLLVIPGPAVGYVVAQSVSRGVRAGIAASAGNVTGGILHVLLAMAGLAVFIVRFPAAYDVLRFAGAAYLIWLGVQKLLPSRGAPAEQAPISNAGDMRSAYLGGIAVNATNPKGLLFFGAFLPQFVRPESGNVTAQIAIFGVVFLVLAFFSDSTYALLASRLYRFVRSGGRQKTARYFGAAAYVALGVAAAVLRRR